VSAAGIAVENRLGEGAPADISYEAEFFILSGRPPVLGQCLQDADGLDIARDLLFRRSVTNPVLRLDTEIAARIFAAAGVLPLTDGRPLSG
jgi:hypothetical protein